MNGKQHFSIGTGIGLISSLAYMGGTLDIRNIDINNLNNFSLGRFSMDTLSNVTIGQAVSILVPVTIGSALGSILADIDTDKSKASQIFNKILLGLIVLFSLTYFINPSMLDKFINYGKSSLFSNLGLLIFLINTILGHLSGHRLYTHRWIGTLVFCISSMMAFNRIVAIGFIIGYLSHILADRLTEDGKYLNFFKIQLPMTNSKGEFHVSV